MICRNAAKWFWREEGWRSRMVDSKPQGLQLIDDERRTVQVSLNWTEFKFHVDDRRTWSGLRWWYEMIFRVIFKMIFRMIFRVFSTLAFRVVSTIHSINFLRWRELPRVNSLGELFEFHLLVLIAAPIAYCDFEKSNSQCSVLNDIWQSLAVPLTFSGSLPRFP